MSRIVAVLKRIRYYALGVHPETAGKYEDLSLLLRRARNRMKIKPVCPFCPTEMRLRGSIIRGGGYDNTPSGSPIRDDQNWKCTNCFHTAIFGLPLTREQARQEVKLRGGSVVLCWPHVRLSESHRKDVRERLRALGYLDFDK